MSLPSLTPAPRFGTGLPSLGEKLDAVAVPNDSDEVLQITLSTDSHDPTAVIVSFAGKNIDPDEDDDVITVLLLGLESLGVDTSVLRSN